MIKSEYRRKIKKTRKDFKSDKEYIKYIQKLYLSPIELENIKLKEEIERLNNIINEIDMMLKTLIMESDFSNHKLTAQVILMNLNELRGFNKGVDKE